MAWDGEIDYAECAHCHEVIEAPKQSLEDVMDRHHVEVHGCPELGENGHEPDLADALMADMNSELDCGHTAVDHFLLATDKSVTGSPFALERHHLADRRRIH